MSGNADSKHQIIIPIRGANGLSVAYEAFSGEAALKAKKELAGGVVVTQRLAAVNAEPPSPPRATPAARGSVFRHIASLFQKLESKTVELESRLRVQEAQIRIAVMVDSVIGRFPLLNRLSEAFDRIDAIERGDRTLGIERKLQARLSDYITKNHDTMRQIESRLLAEISSARGEFEAFRREIAPLLLALQTTDNSDAV